MAIDRVGAALALALSLALSACNPGSTVTEGPRETTITGRLGGEAHGEVFCAWIETDSGQRVEVMYLNAWRVQPNPMAVYDDTGSVVATSGDTLTIRGYDAEVGASLCGPDRLFSAIEMTKVGGPVPSGSP